MLQVSLAFGDGCCAFGGCQKPEQTEVKVSVFGLPEPGVGKIVLHAVFIGIKGIELKSRALICRIGRLHLRCSHENHRAHDRA